ncbi:hypothetical protein LJB42_003730 [Komagataella kurtzmanii]|nr:hypothetical protein LJB42_003730 [Komagataella kurtzmanii]
MFIRHRIRLFSYSCGRLTQEYNKTLLSKSLGVKTDSGSITRCTVYDATGNASSVSSRTLKNELLLKHELLPRDLRKIDKGYDDIVPAILIRPSSILINVLHIRALIRSDRVILFNQGPSNSHTNTMFLNDLAAKLKTPTKEAGIPYEIRALEAIFISVVSNLQSEMKVNTMVIKGILKELEDHIDRIKLRYLLVQSKKLKQFHQKAALIRNLLEELLEQDDELAALYLSEKRSFHDHQEVEMLLESYLAHCDEIVQRVETYLSNVRTTEEIINIILDSNRNQLMLLGLRFSIGLLSFGGLIFVASLYGMNLENFVEESDYWFWIIVGGSTTLCILVFAKGVKALSKLERVSMLGDDLKPLTQVRRFRNN